MNRFLTRFNLAGVLALATLCTWQWCENRRVHLDLAAALEARRATASRLDEQSGALRGLASDLDAFRERLGASIAAREDAEKRAKALAEANAVLADERDRLKASAAEWNQAIADRDRLLREADASLRRVVAERDAIAARFNALAETHNALVERLNTPAAPRPQ